MQFPQAGVFLVGGIVRDLIMNRPIGDIDLVVRNVPIEELVRFLKTQGDANMVGKHFGVIKFRPKGESVSFDIALPRTDHSLNTGGYRDVNVAYDHNLPIEKDLERRDFTCNAIALRIHSKFEAQNSKKGNTTNHCQLTAIHSALIDPYNGLRDIKKNVIRAVGDPKKRFKEDYTRMLRALRLACQLNFKIEKKTWDSIKKKVKEINKQGVKQTFVIARELIAKEFLKGMYHDPARMIELMDKSGLLKELIPELLTLKTCKQDPRWHSEGTAWVHTLLALSLAHSFCHLNTNESASLRALTRGSNNKNKRQKNVRLFNIPFDFLTPQSNVEMTLQDRLELYLGILFHDIGKPRTAGHEKKGDKKAITHYGHETVGAEMTKTICDRLRLSAPEEYRVDSDHVVWLVRNHLLMNLWNAKQMRNSTLEKYFFNPLAPGSILLGLCFFDGLSSIPKTKADLYTRYQSFLTGNKPFPLTPKQLKTWISIDGWWTIITRLKTLSKGRRALPRPLLNGNDIMKLLNIKPGPTVGNIIEQLREAQLAGTVNDSIQAKQFLKNLTY